MRKILTAISLFLGLLGFQLDCHAGLFSLDPINVPEERFPHSNKAEPSGVPLETEYIIHGGDIGSTSTDSWDNPVNFWHPPYPMFLLIYLKNENGKWVPLAKSDAESAIGSDPSIERLVYIYSTKYMRGRAKAEPWQGNFVVNSDPRSYRMNRLHEDNLVALYTNRGCIVPDPRNTIDQKFLIMNCGCREPSKDRQKFGYSFCTSSFNKDGKIDIEAIQAALNQAGGLPNTLNVSNGISFTNPDEYWQIAQAAKAKKEEEEQAIRTKKQAAVEAEKYQALKINLENATSKREIESVISELNHRMRWGVRKDDPDGLLNKAQQKLEPFLLAERRQQEAQEAARLRRLENKQIGDQVCVDREGTVEQSTGYQVYGQPQYRKVSGSNHIVGFVEGISGKKIQIRISGINFSGGGINESMDSLTGFNGGSTLKVNSVIWDSIYAWEGC